MGTLAQDIRNRVIRLVYAFKRKEAEQSEAEQLEEDDEEEEHKFDSMSDPLSPHLGSRLKSLSTTGPIQIISDSLAYPILLSGRWEVWDHNLKVLNGYCMMYMLLHSGTKETDYTLD